MTSSPQRLGGLRLLRLSHGTDLHIEDYNIRVKVHCLRSRCSYHTGMTSTNTDNHNVVCELGLRLLFKPILLASVTYFSNMPPASYVFVTYECGIGDEAI